MSFTKIPSIAQSTANQALAQVLQAAQRQSLNNLVQKQRRAIQHFEASLDFLEDFEQQKADFEARVQVEKQRVKVYNHLMAKYGLTYSIYLEEAAFRQFLLGLEDQYNEHDRMLLREVREGLGLEFLEYCDNDQGWVVTVDGEDDDTTVRQSVAAAMAEFTAQMDNVAQGQWSAYAQREQESDADDDGESIMTSDCEENVDEEMQSTQDEEEEEEE